MNPSTKTFDRARYKFQSGQKIAESSNVLNCLKETNDIIRSSDQGWDVFKTEVVIQIQQVRLL